jgi:uncharacterized protein (TIGR03437 family)
VVHSAYGQSGAIAPGELITLYGTYLGVAAATLPLSADGIEPVEYSGTSVSINGTAAPLLFVSPTQVNAIVPFGINTLASAELKTQAFGYSSEPLMLPAAPASPGLFTKDGSGQGQAAALNQDSTSNSTSNPASAGDVVTVYGTGFGATVPMSQDGAITDSNLLNIALPVRVTVAGEDAQVTYAGSAPGLLSGVSQINFKIPSGLNSGAAAVVVTVADLSSAAGVTIAVK